MCFAQVIWLCAYYLQNTERLGERNENEKVRKKKQQENHRCVGGGIGGGDSGSRESVSYSTEHDVWQDVR